MKNNDSKIYYVYYLLNKINNKIYVGRTYSPERRFLAHCKNSERNINLAIKKDKVENFQLYLIADTKDLYESGELEKYYIKLWKTTDQQFGYNISGGGLGGNPLVGGTEEQRKIRSQKIRIGNLGKKTPIEVRKKQSLAHAGQNNHMFGRKHTEESKRKNRESQLGEKHWRSVKFTEDEEKFIIENRNNGISGREITKMINLKFNKNITHKPIYRFLRNKKNDNQYTK